MIKETLLTSGLSRLLDSAVILVTKKTLMVYSDMNIKLLLESLSDLEQQGYLKILRDVRKAKNNDICIEMLNWIEYEGYYKISEASVQKRLMGLCKRLYSKGIRTLEKRDILELVKRFPYHIPQGEEALKIVHEYLLLNDKIFKEDGPFGIKALLYIKNIYEASDDDVCVELYEDVLDREDILDVPGILTYPLEGKLAKTKKESFIKRLFSRKDK